MGWIGVGEKARTSNSSRVNMCFKMTTLSHRELVSGKVDGSSSSQSASLLVLSQTAVGIVPVDLTHLLSFCVFFMIFFLSLPLLFAGASFCAL
jgi:hypothetical protein